MIFIFIKFVGLIPVFLAIGGFVFLVFLLSYHTLKKSFEQLEADRSHFIKVGRQLYAVAKKLIEIVQAKEDLLNNYDTIISLASTLQSEKVSMQEAIRANILLQRELSLLSVLVKNSLELSRDTYIQSLLEQMQNAEKDYQTAYKKYAYSLKYYNKFVETLPSKWVAWIVGYKKISTSFTTSQVQ